MTGDVKLKLYQGNMINAGVTSPFTLYDEQTASFGVDKDYDQSDATGFINLFGQMCIRDRCCCALYCPPCSAWCSARWSASWAGSRKAI